MHNLLVIHYAKIDCCNLNCVILAFNEVCHFLFFKTRYNKSLAHLSRMLIGKLTYQTSLSHQPSSSVNIFKIFTSKDTMPIEIDCNEIILSSLVFKRSKHTSTEVSLVNFKVLADLHRPFVFVIRRPSTFSNICSKVTLLI